VQREAEALRKVGHDLVYTFHFKTDADRTAIPENASSAVEARSKSAETLKLFEAIVDAAVQKVRDMGYGVNANADKMKRTVPVSLNTECQDIIRAEAGALGISTLDMTSGAGHDLMNYAPKVSAGFISVAHGNGGLSHNPGEILGMTAKQDPFSEGSYPDAINLMARIVTRDERLCGTPNEVSHAVSHVVSRGDFVAELQKRGAKPLALAA